MLLVIVVVIVAVAAMVASAGQASKQRGLHWAEPEPKRFSSVACMDKT